MLKAEMPLHALLTKYTMYNVHKQMALECKTMLCDDGETLQKPEMTLSAPGFGDVGNNVTIQVCPCVARIEEKDFIVGV